jgi:hypothetical protein
MRAALVLGLAAAGARGQERYPLFPVHPGQAQSLPSSTPPQPGVDPQSVSPLNMQPPRWSDGFQDLELLVYPRYQGFPNFMPQPQGYGGYPAGPGPGGAAGVFGDWLPPPLPDERRRRWPSWIDVEPGPDGEIASPTRALLARTADSVWYLGARDNAFVPLPFFDKFRPLEAGAALEVPNQGSFHVAFHDGGRMLSNGPVRLSIVTLDAQIAALELARFTRVTIAATERPLRVRLPDGSTAVVRGGAAYLGGDGERGYLLNEGPAALSWERGERTVDLEAGQRVDVLCFQADRPALGAELAGAGAVRLEREGRLAIARGEGEGGHVTWSGARIAVPAGAVLRLDCLVGEGFSEKR